MINRIVLLFALIAFLLFIVQSVGAAMQSQNYRIPVYVISGGGSNLNSTSYKIKSTSGQSSALMNSLDYPFSDNYDLYPGFWYTIGYWEIPKRVKTTPLILLLLNQ